MTLGEQPLGGESQDKDRRTSKREAQQQHEDPSVPLHVVSPLRPQSFLLLAHRSLLDLSYPTRIESGKSSRHPNNFNVRPLNTHKQDGVRRLQRRHDEQVAQDRQDCTHLLTVLARHFYRSLIVPGACLSRRQRHHQRSPAPEYCPRAAY